MLSLVNRSNCYLSFSLNNCQFKQIEFSSFIFLIILTCRQTQFSSFAFILKNLICPHHYVQLSVLSLLSVILFSNFPDLPFSRLKFQFWSFSSPQQLLISMCIPVGCSLHDYVMIGSPPTQLISTQLMHTKWQIIQLNTKKSLLVVYILVAVAMIEKLVRDLSD